MHLNLIPLFAPLRLRGSIFSLIIAGAVTAFALTAAYQVRPVQVIEVGDAAHDTALLRGFYGPERQSAGDGGRRYRWTRETGEIVFPGFGRGPARVELTLNRDANPNDTVRVLANGGELATLTLAPRFESYTIDVPAAYLTSGNLTLALRTTPFVSAGDPSTRRTLGVVVSRMAITQQGTGFVLPPARVALALWLGVMGITLGLIITGVGRDRCGDRRGGYGRRAGSSGWSWIGLRDNRCRRHRRKRCAQWLPLRRSCGCSCRLYAAGGG